MRAKKGSGIGRGSKVAREWAKNVKLRDENKCTQCDCKTQLHAHHIIPWEEREDLRFDLNNGITLCKICHAKEEGFKKGREVSKEIRENLSRNFMENPRPSPMTGKKHSEETKKKMREAKIGYIPYNKGKKKEPERFKKCKVCNVEKPQDRFTKGSRGYTRNECKDCRNFQLRGNWELRREKINKLRRDKRKKDHGYK